MRCNGAYTFGHALAICSSTATTGASSAAIWRGCDGPSLRRASFSTVPKRRGYDRGGVSVVAVGALGRLRRRNPEYCGRSPFSVWGCMAFVDAVGVAVDHKHLRDGWFAPLMASADSARSDTSSKDGAALLATTATERRRRRGSKAAAVMMTTTTKKKTKTKTKTTNVMDEMKRDTKNMNTKKSRLRKDEMNILVRELGLTPVERTSNPSKRGTKSNDNARRVARRTSTDAAATFTSKTVISLQTQLQYARDGHAVLRSFLPHQAIHKIRSELIPYVTDRSLEAWRQKVEVVTDSASAAYKCRTVEECRTALEKAGFVPSSSSPYSSPRDMTLPFLQHFNSWRALASARNVALSETLGQAASTLMDVPSVRLYQDSCFHKRCGDGPTPWHSDARMAPFDTSSMITFWIPLGHVPAPERGGTGLWFADKSHADFALPFWNDLDGVEYGRLEDRYGGSVRHHMPLDVGDVTVHSGWTLHCADGLSPHPGGGGGDDDRYALAITYVDARAEVREGAGAAARAAAESANGKEVRRPYGEKNQVGHDEDRWSYRDWVDEVEPRTKFDHHLVPIVYPPK